MQLLGKNAILTGAGSGIGKAAALLFAKEGAAVCLVSRTEEELRQTVDEIERAGGRAIYAVADVSAPDEMKRAVASTIEAFGGLDIVFANAGVNGVWAPIEELEPEEWDDTLNINLKGTFLTVKYAIPHLKKQGGSIVITASVNGTRIFSNAGATAYSCSKAAQVAFTKMAALELAKHKIRVNVICPGAIETEIDDSSRKRDIDEAKEPAEYPAGKIPLTGGKPGTAAEVAQLVLFLAGDGSSHVTGTEVWIDGAESLLQG
ncbi:MAG: 3-oxoacyl-[acyl-carrier protein] reductase [uncultured Pyrinomonadaceae bacterium]|uniref:3-oxoacyl-[acyl-carrier protein] reductase n=1 Tax=uncultured Pyrinomonadaceae bacterium TaxID=2283094 RepID=A0A6J4P7G0_9BACT|nr:MAG: 3-oxoacyl-[acyl-carrier protein] reductase [uncultured Pyrinomonadaceae bacterium]